MSSSATDKMPPRVFVSSVMTGFEDYRQAAKSAISAAGADPVLVEDYPSLASSPRNACLDGVRSCDAFVLVLGNRGGFVAPSGKLVVEEELAQAEASGLPVLIFIQECERDHRAEDLFKRVSDYTSGYFRKTFTTPPSLAATVKSAVQSMAFTGDKADMTPIGDVFAVMPKLDDQCSMRFVVASSRNEQVVDPVTLDSDTVKNSIMELAHRGDVTLFSYEVGKSTSAGVDSLVITQDDDRRAGHLDSARIELFSSGTILIDANVTNRVPSRQSHSMQAYYEVVDEDIRDRLQAAFAFCRLFWDQTDPYLRHQQFHYNAALNNIGNRTIVSDRNPRSSFSMGFGQHEPIVAFPDVRLCSRKGLAQPADHIDAVLTMFRRQLTRHH
jgi:hypothetical protein